MQMRVKSFKIDDALEATLIEYAAEHNYTDAFIIRTALTEYFQRMKPDVKLFSPIQYASCYSKADRADKAEKKKTIIEKQ